MCLLFLTLGTLPIGPTVRSVPASYIFIVSVVLMRGRHTLLFPNVKDLSFERCTIYLYVSELSPGMVALLVMFTHGKALLNKLPFLQTVLDIQGRGKWDNMEKVMRTEERMGLGKTREEGHERNNGRRNKMNNGRGNKRNNGRGNKRNNGRETRGIMEWETRGIMGGETKGIMGGEIRGIMGGETRGRMGGEIRGIMGGESRGIMEGEQKE